MQNIYTFYAKEWQIGCHSLYRGLSQVCYNVSVLILFLRQLLLEKEYYFLNEYE